MESIQYFPVTGIIGPRQVGKTTLSKDILQFIDKKGIYLDLENPRDSNQLADPVLFFESNKDKCVILDEIQRMPDLFPILRSMIDDHRVPGRFIILGSASPNLIRDSSESLAGRIAYWELTPFIINEVIHDFETMKTHWLRGGYPNAYLAPSNRLSFQWISNFVKTYIERDLPLLGLNIERNTILKLWTMIAHMNASVLNMSNLAKSLGTSSTTIKKYLHFLEEAFLIRQLRPYAINVKKRLVKSPKIYIRDTGTLHYLLGITSTNDLEYHPSLGTSWEGYATEQILNSMNENLTGYYYRTHNGAECDLVIVKGGKPIASIEIKYSSAPKLSKGNLQSFEDLNTTQNYVITPNTEDYLIRNDIRVCSLQDLVKGYLQKM
ncbi:MAG: ATP-binding protein [Bacteroidota bacterium]